MSARANRSESPIEDTDSPMQNSDSEDIVPSSIAQITPSTPTHLQQNISSELSPPDSQGPPRRTGPTGFGAMTPSELLNANGKRTYDAAANSTSGTAAASDSKGKFSHPSGYTWDTEEDAPGYTWLNKKAQEEHFRALNTIVDLELAIKNRYGDVLLDKAAE